MNLWLVLGGLLAVACVLLVALLLAPCAARAEDGRGPDTAYWTDRGWATNAPIKIASRIDTPDGLQGDEGTFSICTFWYVEALARAGNTADARLAFEKMLTYANHLGLYSEEIGPSGEALGNFPQAFTHLALINALMHVIRAEDGPGPMAHPLVD